MSSIMMLLNPIQFIDRFSKSFSYYVEARSPRKFGNPPLAQDTTLVGKLTGQPIV